MKDNMELLKSVTMFSLLKDKYIKLICNVLKEREFKAGDVIVKQGDTGVGMFIIKSGKVKIVKTIGSGDDIDIAEHGTGEFFGEFAVLDKQTRTASVVAVEDTRTVAMTHWEFQSLMEAHPEIALQILPVILKRFRETNDQLLLLQKQ